MTSVVSNQYNYCRSLVLDIQISEIYMIFKDRYSDSSDSSIVLI